jgi:hypothetical protein
LRTTASNGERACKHRPSLLADSELLRGAVAERPIEPDQR